MKKHLLLAAATLLAGTTAFAQAVVFDGAALGLNSSEVTEIAAGTSFGSNDGIDVSAAFTDSYKISYLSDEYIVFGEESISLTYGIRATPTRRMLRVVTRPTHCSSP